MVQFMTDRKALAEPNETPEDVATLYSWANLHGAKYRDFSASRAQTREKARQRVQDAIEEERQRSHQEAETQKAAEVERAADAVRAADAAARQAKEAAELAMVQAAQKASRQAAAERSVQQAGEQAAQAAIRQAAQQRTWQQPVPRAERLSSLPVSIPDKSVPHFAPPQTDYSPLSPAPVYRTTSVVSQYATPREESYVQPRSQWTPAEPGESSGRPAWLATERADLSAAPQAPEDTLQGSRDRLTSRWFALKGVFDGSSVPVEVAPSPVASRIPTLAVFSLAGGVGKTSLVATLGRALSARGERVLLVDTAAYGLLPFFFGAHDQRPGTLRTFSPPGVSGDAPIQMVTIDPDTLGPDAANPESLTSEIGKFSRGAGRVIVDLATASGATTRRLMRMAPTVLVPVIADMNSVVSVSSIDAFFEHNSAAAGKQVTPYYVLNQFDPSLPLHLDVREVLREQLGDRLLPFALRRAPAVSEALAEGMTVVDYAPNSTVAEDFGSLAGWVKSLAAPAATGYRGVRWSER
jgi:cellulose synthase operon protein YhjQ